MLLAVVHLNGELYSVEGSTCGVCRRPVLLVSRGGGHGPAVLYDHVIIVPGNPTGKRHTGCAAAPSPGPARGDREDPPQGREPRRWFFQGGAR